MTSAARDLSTLGETIEPVVQAVPESVLARARLVVASFAHDAADCRQLLEALGLLEPVDPALSPAE
ncbi:hypothetical protein [Kitasatospora sp. NPDC094015]|uniref:hypothetical protein n=1 Tax=Kitasatospora sp. NPDC094015 TaxID=3155205 RepID=UPI00332457B6